jgi:hypothetical protein
LWRGRSFSQSFGQWDQFTGVDLREVVPRLEVPVYFLEGKYDYTCNTDLAREYFRALDAPRKGFYEFDDSAHSPMLEQQAQVHRVLQVDVLTGHIHWPTSGDIRLRRCRSVEKRTGRWDGEPLRTDCDSRQPCEIGRPQ